MNRLAYCVKTVMFEILSEFVFPKIVQSLSSIPYGAVSANRDLNWCLVVITYFVSLRYVKNILGKYVQNAPDIMN